MPSCGSETRVGEHVKGRRDTGHEREAIERRVEEVQAVDPELGTERP